MSEPDHDGGDLGDEDLRRHYLAMTPAERLAEMERLAELMPPERLAVKLGIGRMNLPDPADCDEARAAHYIRALGDGDFIDPPDGGSWTANDLLALAGACLFFARGFGPFAGEMHPERREAKDETVDADLIDKIQRHRWATMLVMWSGKADPAP